MMWGRWASSTAASKGKEGLAAGPQQQGDISGSFQGVEVIDQNWRGIAQIGMDLDFDGVHAHGLGVGQIIPRLGWLPKTRTADAEGPAGAGLAHGLGHRPYILVVQAGEFAAAVGQHQNGRSLCAEPIHVCSHGLVVHCAALVKAQIERDHRSFHAR